MNDAHVADGLLLRGRRAGQPLARSMGRLGGLQLVARGPQGLVEPSGWAVTGRNVDRVAMNLDTAVFDGDVSPARRAVQMLTACQRRFSTKTCWLSMLVIPCPTAGKIRKTQWSVNEVKAA